MSYKNLKEDFNLRLRDIKERLVKNLPILKNIQFNGSQGANKDLYKVTNFKEAIDSLLDLKCFNFISTDFENIDSLDIFNARTSTILITNNEFNLFKQTLDRIIIKCEALISAIDQIIPSQNNFSVSIKLPPINTLSELSEITKDINNALNQTLLHPNINGKVELQNFDTGSNWFEVVLGNKEAFAFVGGIVWSALEIHKKLIENAIMKQRLKSLQIKNDALEDLEGALSKALDQELTEQCQDKALQLLAENNIPTNDNEYNLKTGHSIKIIAQLIFDGAEFHQPSIAQSDNKQLFPDFKSLNQLESSVKELTGNTPNQE